MSNFVLILKYLGKEKGPAPNAPEDKEDIIGNYIYKFNSRDESLAKPKKCGVCL